MRTYAFIALALTTAACTADSFHPGESDSGPPDNQVGGDGGFEQDAAVPPGCDTSKLPADDACTVNDAQGIFVSSSKGSANGNGTQAKPLASLDAAIALAKTAKRRVYACGETYAEQVQFQDGVSVFGYFTCGSTWAVSTAHAKIAPTASPAASASNITTATRVEAVDMVSPDFTDKSQSSIALFVNNAPALTIAHATIHAGTGGKGADGANGIQLNDSGSSKNGQDAWAAGKCTGSTCKFVVHTGSPAGGTNACTNATGHDGGPGGAGGDSGYFLSQYVYPNYTWVVQNNENSTVGLPTTATSQTNQGGAISSGGLNGVAGANGQSGISGINFGNIASGAYVPSDGTAGTDGAPGQGGGGAGAMFLASIYSAQAYSGYYGWGEPGAGGGAGGCPGLAAGAGKGGGASIAIVALGAGFTLDTVAIDASKGGDGGSAGAPSAPSGGGLSGAAGQYVPSAGNGGAGGLAGVSGNGGGGPSLGITYDKTKPAMLGSSSVKQGAGGSGVAARTVNGQTIPASDNGMSSDVYMFGQ